MKAKTQCVKSNLGLVCITTTDAVRYKTVTRKRLLSFDEPVQQEMLRIIYQENINRINNAIEFCAANGINLYRLTSGLFPFSDEPIGAKILEDFAEQLSVTGRKAIANNLRIVMHPDQYVVLSSDSEAVVENSVKILKMHAKTLDLLQQPRSEWATMNIHGGKGDRTDKLVESVEKLPFEVRSRIAFENDEHAYSSAQILEVCRRASVPMVFDAHHHICREKLDDYNDESVAEMFWAARETWKNPENQMVHISNGRDYFQDRAHHDLIFTMPEVFRFAPWIEIEAKHKEIAIEKLNNEWLTNSLSR
ncbi:MAG: UV DNA damage repair endonuclease UvsE [Acidobacteriota bacterium]|nr:UV DNA damage repair endonuclease UvsE [Acidobacteriota bacterium]